MIKEYSNGKFNFARINGINETVNGIEVFADLLEMVDGVIVYEEKGYVLTDIELTEDEMNLLKPNQNEKVLH